MKKYDAIVIGAGPGGYELAAALAAAGKRTAIIERDEPGGTCLNRGCIPTKALCSSGTAPWGESASRANAVIAELRESVRAVLKDVDYIKADAKLKPGLTVSAGADELTADSIYIATGSEPSRLEIPGAELALDSTQLLASEEIPGRVAIIGGGVIGLEFACILADKGAEVTVIEYCKEILPTADKEIAKRLQSLLKRRGITFVTGTAVKAVKAGYTVEYEGKKGPAAIEADMVVMAVGRKAVVPEGCIEAGVELDAKGFIKTDAATMETTAKGIYAIGDCNGRCLLAHAASAQGRVARGLQVAMEAMPSVVFTHPPCAWTGRTEEELAAEGIDYACGKTMYAGNGKAMADGTPEGFVKVLSERASGRILGVHIVGAAADSIIGEATLAIAASLDATTVGTRVIHPHPTLCEVFSSACAKCR